MKGYKVFNPDFSCRGFQYEVGKVFDIPGKPKCCRNGAHFCAELVNCFNYYSFNPANKVAEIEALGEIDTNDDGKSCTNKIKIVRELSWEEVLKMVNMGIGNYGWGNSGDYNTGNHNTGSHNSGKGNSGFYNSGFYNTGNRNSGSFNSGNRNHGYANSGSYNGGFGNSGNHNGGDYNSGCCNGGDYNSGDYNSGNYNSGYCNSTTPKVRLFNHETDFDFDSNEIIKLNDILIRCPQSYECSNFVSKKNMTEDEIKKHPDCEITGGYVKDVNIEADKQKWWDEQVSKEDKDFIKSLPHFDADVFYECVGIRV